MPEGLGFVPLCRLGDLRNGRLTVRLDPSERGDDGAVLVVQHKGQLFAVDGHCPHQFAPLEGGEVDGDGVLTCPQHGWRFRLQDGKSPDNPWIWVTSYDTRMDDDGTVLIAPRSIPKP
jgi:nitrite reductase/ring-hydroxylating ferredoxin subunit